MATDDHEARAPTTDETSPDMSPASPRPKSVLRLIALLASGLGVLLAVGGGGFYYLTAKPPAPPAVVATAKPAIPAQRTPDDVFSVPLSSSVPLNNKVSESNPADATAVEQSTPAETFTLESLRRADRLLIDGHVAEALNSYGRMSHSASPHLYESLFYRAAVARELLGDFPSALQAYRQLVERSNLPRVVTAGKLGQSRVWLRTSKPELAIPVLGQLAMAPIVALHPDDTLAAEVHHLLAIALDQLASRAAEGVTLAQDSYCAGIPPAWSADYLMSLPTPPEQAQDQEIPDGILVLYQFGQLPDEIQLSVSLLEQPLVEIVNQIASEAKATANWSPEAAQRVARRSARVIAPSVSFAVLLDTVLAPYDLIWVSQNGKLIIQTTKETAPGKLAAAVQDRAVRSLQSALVLYPDHPLTPTSYLCLGNAEFRMSDYESAEATYRQLIRLFPQTPGSVEASFNVAKSLLNRNRPEDAAKVFYSVVDSAHGHPLRPAAYLYAGRIHLEAGDLSAAIRPLMRATALASDAKLKSTAALTLSNAYFLADNYHAANTVLMEHQKILQSDASRGGAVLVTAMVQWRVAGKTSDSRGGRALINALNQVTPEDFFSRAGNLLIGNALSTAGLMEQTAILYEQALQDGLPRWVSDTMREFLVEYRMLVGEYSKAEEQLTVLTASPDHKIARNARIQVAKLEKRKGNDETFLSVCRELLNEELSTAQKTEVLKLMGHTFAAHSRHYEAALCFAGMIPPQSTGVDQVPGSNTRPFDTRPFDSRQLNAIKAPIQPDGS